LRKENTCVCGTIKQNKIPKEIKSVTVPVGHSKAMRSNEILIIKYQPKAKKFVHIISTIHNEQEILVNLRGRNAQEYKPLAVTDYNRYMGGVDKVDQVFCIELINII
jgi:hypothetical protein